MLQIFFPEREPCSQLIMSLVDPALRQKSKGCMSVCVRACVGVQERESKRGKEREGAGRVRGGGEGGREMRRKGEKKWGCIVRGGKVSIIVACCEGNFFTIISAFRG